MKIPMHHRGRHALKTRETLLQQSNALAKLAGQLRLIAGDGVSKHMQRSDLMRISTDRKPRDLQTVQFRQPQASYARVPERTVVRFPCISAQLRPTRLPLQYQLEIGKVLHWSWNPETFVPVEA